MFQRKLCLNAVRGQSTNPLRRSISPTAPPIINASWLFLPCWESAGGVEDNVSLSMRGFVRLRHEIHHTWDINYETCAQPLTCFSGYLPIPSLAGFLEEDEEGRERKLGLIIMA